MSDCFEPSARSSAQAYAGHAVTPPASAMPSTLARSLDVNVVMLSPVLFSAEPIVPGTATSSAREAAPLVMQKRHGGDDLWRNMAAGGDRLYWRPFRTPEIRHAASRLPAPTTAGVARRPRCSRLVPGGRAR